MGRSTSDKDTEGSTHILVPFFVSSCCVQAEALKSSGRRSEKGLGRRISWPSPQTGHPVLEGGNPAYSSPLFILVNAIFLPQSALRILGLSCSPLWKILSTGGQLTLFGDVFDCHNCGVRLA